MTLDNTGNRVTRGKNRSPAGTDGLLKLTEISVERLRSAAAPNHRNEPAKAQQAHGSGLRYDCPDIHTHPVAR